MSETELYSDVEKIATDINDVEENMSINTKMIDSNDSEKSFESCDNKDDDSEKSFASCSPDVENKEIADIQEVNNENVVDINTEETDDEDDIRPGSCREVASSDEEASSWDEKNDEWVYDKELISHSKDGNTVPKAHISEENLRSCQEDLREIVENHVHKDALPFKEIEVSEYANCQNQENICEKPKEKNLDKRKKDINVDPSVIPTSGKFFMHDLRTEDNVEKIPEKYPTKKDEGRWQHDLYISHDRTPPRTQPNSNYNTYPNKGNKRRSRRNGNQRSYYNDYYYDNYYYYSEEPYYYNYDYYNGAEPSYGSQWGCDKSNQCREYVNDRNYGNYRNNRRNDLRNETNNPNDLVNNRNLNDLSKEPMNDRRNQIIKDNRNEPMKGRKNESLNDQGNELSSNRRNVPSKGRRDEPIIDRKNEPTNNRRNQPIDHRINYPLDDRRNEPINDRRNEPINDRRNDLTNNRRNNPMDDRRNEPINVRRNEAIIDRRNESFNDRRNEPFKNRINEHINDRRNDPTKVRSNETINDRRDYPMKDQRNETLNDRAYDPMGDRRNEVMHSRKNETTIDRRNRPMSDWRNESINDQRNDKRNQYIKGNRNEMLGERQNESMGDHRKDPIRDRLKEPMNPRRIDESDRRHGQHQERLSEPRSDIMKGHKNEYMNERNGPNERYDRRSDPRQIEHVHDEEAFNSRNCRNDSSMVDRQSRFNDMQPRYRGPMDDGRSADWNDPRGRRNNDRNRNFNNSDSRRDYNPNQNDSRKGGMTYNWEPRDDRFGRRGDEEEFGRARDRQPVHGRYSDIKEYTSIKVIVDSDNLGTRRIKNVASSVNAPDNSIDRVKSGRDQCQWDVSNDLADVIEEMPPLTEKEMNQIKQKPNKMNNPPPRFSRVGATEKPIVSRGQPIVPKRYSEMRPNDVSHALPTNVDFYGTMPQLLVNLSPGVHHSPQAPPPHHHHQTSSPSSYGGMQPQMMPMSPSSVPFFMPPFFVQATQSRLNQFSEPFHPKNQSGQPIAAGTLNQQSPSPAAAAASVSNTRPVLGRT